MWWLCEEQNNSYCIKVTQDLRNNTRPDVSFKHNVACQSGPYQHSQFHACFILTSNHGSPQSLEGTWSQGVGADVGLVSGLLPLLERFPAVEISEKFLLLEMNTCSYPDLPKVIQQASGRATHRTQIPSVPVQ